MAANKLYTFIMTGIFALSSVLFTTSVCADYTDKYMTQNMQLFRSQDNGDIKKVTTAKQVVLNTPVYQKVRQHGVNRPLSEAVQKIVTGDCWRVIIENGLEGKKVTWYAGHEWPDVLSDMAKNSNIFVHVNHEKCLVAIGSTSEIAKQLATSDGEVWKMIAGKSLRANLEDWAQRAGWHLEWELPFDYNIEFPATLIGDFYGTHGGDGVVAKVMDAYKEHEVPLRAHFIQDNKVVVIKERRAIQR